MAVDASGPSELVQVDTAVRVERDSFRLEQRPLDMLERRPAASRADLTARIDHAVPRHVVTVGERGHGVPHLARATRKTRLASHGAIRRDSSGGNATDDGVEVGVCGHGGPTVSPDVGIRQLLRGTTPDGEPNPR